MESSLGAVWKLREMGSDGVRAGRRKSMLLLAPPILDRSVCCRERTAMSSKVSRMPNLGHRETPHRSQSMGRTGAENVRFPYRQKPCSSAPRLLGLSYYANKPPMVRHYGKNIDACENWFCGIRRFGKDRLAGESCWLTLQVLPLFTGIRQFAPNVLRRHATETASVHGPGDSSLLLLAARLAGVCRIPARSRRPVRLP